MNVQRDQGLRGRVGRLAVAGGKALLFVLITCAVGEVAARVVLDIQPLTPGALVWERHDRWGWRHRPEAEDLFVKLGTRQRIQINSLGLREREIPYEKPPGTYRVLVIGDSSVVGFEVAAQDVFTRVLENVLRAEGRDVQVINGGHRGYGTGQALLFLMDEGLKYDPDLVLYKWTLNDLDDNASVHRPYRRFGKGWFDLVDERLVLRGTPVPEYGYSANLRVGPDGEVAELGVPASVRLRMWVRDELVCRSSFAVVLTHIAAAIPQLTGFVQQAGSYADFRDFGPEFQGSDRLFLVTAELLREMRRACAESGAALRVIGTWDPVGDALREAAGIPPVEDRSEFSRIRSPGTRLLVPFDPHWNEVGHRLYGEALAAALAKTGLLPAPREPAAARAAQAS